MGGSDLCLSVAGPRVISETIAGETVVITRVCPTRCLSNGDGAVPSTGRAQA